MLTPVHWKSGDKNRLLSVQVPTYYSDRGLETQHRHRVEDFDERENEERQVFYVSEEGTPSHQVVERPFQILQGDLVDERISLLQVVESVVDWMSY